MPSPAKTDSRPSQPGQTGQPSPSSAQPSQLPEGMPNVIGKGLAAARDQLKQAGYTVRSHDATSRSRVQVDLRNWQVCFQYVENATGEQKPRVDLGVVALDEDCPATDEGLTPPTVADDGTLPDFTGRGVVEARQALGLRASVRAVDASGEDRRVLWEKDWQICAQSPGPGTKWTGQPIRFDVVKWSEQCP